MDTLLIPRNTSALLQSLSDRLNRGYTFWTSGVIQTLKANDLCRKFHERYYVLAPRHKRAYHHKLGRANSYFVMYPQVGGDSMDWVLMATRGTGAIHEHESLHDHHSGAHPDRLHWRHYEVVTRNHRMTWRLRRSVVDEWEKKVIAAARKKNLTDLEQTVKILCHFPLFAGVREQVWTLLQKAQKIRRRHHHTPIHLPKLPYMQRINVYDNPPKTLGKLVNAYQAILATNNLVEERI